MIFNISEFRNPSSTAPISMISLATLDSFGYFVDYMSGGSFDVSMPDTIPISNIAITPQDDTINAITNYQVSYKI